MANATKFPSTKRYGVRYGRTIKEKIGKADLLRRNSKTCIYCLKNKAERLASGIWYCSKCNIKYTGGAYSIKVESKKEEE